MFYRKMDMHCGLEQAEAELDLAVSVTDLTDREVCDIHASADQVEELKGQRAKLWYG